MKNISLFQGILLGIFAVGALVGLFVFATYSGGGAAKAIGPVTIWGPFPKDAMNAALAQMTQSDQGLKSVTYVEKDPATIERDLITAIATDSAPDLVIINQEDLFSLEKVIRPIPPSALSARSFANTFADGSSIFLAPGTTGSYAIPYLIDPLVLYYNRAILSSAAVASVPSTWESLTGLAPRVVVQNASHQLSRGLIALGSYGNVKNARAILSALFLQTGVPIAGISASGQAAADLGVIQQDNGVASGEAVVRFYSQFADPSKVSYSWSPTLANSDTTFANGDLALYLGFASEVNYFRQANPNLSFDLAPFPQPSTATAKLTYGKIYGLAIPRGAKNPNGALTVASTLIGAGPAHIASIATGLAPALRSLLSTEPADAAAAVAYDSALYARGWLSPAPTDTDSIFSTMINGVISGRSTIPAALSSAQSSMNAILQK